jgi:hypothetical protein
MTIKRLLAIPFLMVCLLGVTDLRAQSARMTYDTFMRLDANQQLEQFQLLTPVNRADLLREQLVRWRRLYAERLTPEQNQLLSEVAEFIQPDHFERNGPHSDEFVKAFMSLEERASRAFTPQELHEMSTLSVYLLPQ